MIKGKRISWFLKMLLNAICIVIWFLPTASTYRPETGEYHFFYPYQEMVLLKILIPFCILWVIYQFLKSHWTRVFIRVIMLGIIGWILFLNLLANSLPVQDYIPEIGSLILCLIFPILVILFIVEFLEKKKSKEDDFEDILDV